MVTDSHSGHIFWLRIGRSGRALAEVSPGLEGVPMKAWQTGLEGVPMKAWQTGLEGVPMKAW